MSRYIDAEKLIEKFEKMIDNIPASVDSGAGYVIDEVYKIIDSLQQEQLVNKDLGTLIACDIIEMTVKKAIDKPQDKEKEEELMTRKINYLRSLEENYVQQEQQEQPEGNLEYWLEHFGMPKENIDNCITQIAQGYGACRYLEGVQHGAEAVNELATQEQPEVELDEEITKWIEAGDITDTRFDDYDDSDIERTARHFYELGRARKEE